MPKNNYKKNLNRNAVLTIIVWLCLTVNPLWGLSNPIQISFAPAPGAMPLVDENQTTPIIVDSLDAEVVSLAVQMVAGDIEAISLKKPAILHVIPKKSSTVLIAGTANSTFIHQLTSKGLVDTLALKGKWECFSIQLIQAPFDGIEQALVIIGSDRRGTAYGLMELSRMMGISPWVDWADVHPLPHPAIYVSGDRIISTPPSVKYRGIFLNDEDWGLQPWAARNMNSGIQDIGPKTYEKIFQLMVRLRANYLWPAMHDCTKAFYYYPENAVMADRYAIVAGASHCEPMQRNNVFEWKVNFKNEYGEEPGEWRYDTNAPQIRRYWDDRLKTSSRYETAYTVGMRGIHDSGMPGPKDRQQKIELLGKVIADQRELLKNYYNKPDAVQQIFCPYKEVLELYQQGLKLPDDVTIVWADDNHGYLRQLSSPKEQQRSGRSGIYYHISYWGAPHDFLWLCSTSPSQIAFEMTKAYQFGADRLWIVNVGDIKPAEMETQFFLDMAWNINQWTPENAQLYAEYWARQTFGEELAQPIAEIKEAYYRLAQNGKPEHLRMLAFDHQTMEERLSDYKKLMAEVEATSTKVPKRLEDAWFELVKYPVEGAALMNQKVFDAALSLDAAKQRKQEAIDLATQSQNAFEQIQQMTQQYNTEVANGKWNGIMSYQPRNLPVFSMPPVATAEMVKNPELVIPEDLSKSKYTDSIPGTTLYRIKNGTSVWVADYSSAHEITGEKIIVAKGVGLGGNAVCRYPFTGVSFKEENYSEAPSLLYQTELNPGTYQLSVKCFPSQRIHEGRNLTLAITVNNGEPIFMDVDISSNNKAWGQSVIRGFSEGICPITITRQGTQQIKIYLLDTGLAINRIDIKEK